MRSFHNLSRNIGYFTVKFQKKLRDEIININNNLDIPNALYNAIIVKSKLEIYCFILEEVFNMILQKDMHRAVRCVFICRGIRECASTVWRLTISRR